MFSYKKHDTTSSIDPQALLSITLRWVPVTIMAALNTVAMFVYKVAKFRLKFRQKLKWVQTQRKFSCKG